MGISKCIYTFFYVIKWLSYDIFLNSLCACVKYFGICMYILQKQAILRLTEPCIVAKHS